MDEEIEKLWRKAVEKHTNDELEEEIAFKYERIEKIQEFIANGRKWRD